MIKDFLFSLLILFIFCVVIIFCKNNIKTYNKTFNNDYINKIKELLIPIVPEIKEIEIFEDNKSYTLNKKYIYLCTKNKSGEYYKTNTIVYVLLHEMAHYLNKIDIGHTEHFYKIFNELLGKAEKIGIYNPKINIEKNYCGYKT